ncbi:LCP family protein [Nocardioides sp. CN2-186]|uniref:LCP family protein n=1 Tax=Nocardioides tweenelious TaxID=3156607 RepID=UPI0032B3C8C5
MPPVSSPGSFTAHERAARIRFRRAVSLMLMTLVLPGSAQLVAGNRKVGRIALLTWALLVVTAVPALLAAAIWHGLAFWFVFDTGALLVLRLLLTGLAIGWAYLFVDAWRLGQPLTLNMGHRRAAIGVNGVLCFSVAAALLFSAHLVGVQRGLVLALSGDGVVSGAHDGRYNVLLLGGDSGAGRWGLRPDSMTVASIDADTGRTVLISLPRNMKNFPFVKGSVMHQQFPDGFDADYLNGVSTWAGDNTGLFPKSDNPGVDATIMAIEGITGLKINYWAMVNLEGFKDLVDAVGGVTLNVRQPIPVGGLGDDVTGYIQPGVRKLDGHDALWFARARDDSDDYSRMARQKCVMNAMLQQISPQTAVTNFADIASAGSALVSSDIPSSEFSKFAQLALKARGQKISTLSLVPPMINTADPDIKLIKSKVASAIDRAEGTASAPGSGPKVKDDTVTGGSLGSLRKGYAANEADDLGSAC